MPLTLVHEYDDMPLGLVGPTTCEPLARMSNVVVPAVIDGVAQVAVIVIVLPERDCPQAFSPEHVTVYEPVFVIVRVAVAVPLPVILAPSVGDTDHVNALAVMLLKEDAVIVLLTVCVPLIGKAALFPPVAANERSGTPQPTIQISLFDWSK